MAKAPRLAVTARYGHGDITWLGLVDDLTAARARILRYLEKQISALTNIAFAYLLISFKRFPNMAKGNHVFNAFDKVISKIYREVILIDDSERGRDLDAVGGSGGDANMANANLMARFKHSYGYFREIRDHASMAMIHNIQDDAEVIPNDANSKDFGVEAGNFGTAVMQWATGVGTNDPMDNWRQLVNKGSDPLAKQTYITQGSSVFGTPNSEDARRARCVDVEKFIKAELTGLVRKWMLGIRMDLKLLKKVSYNPSQSVEWKDLLKA